MLNKYISERKQVVILAAAVLAMALFFAYDQYVGLGHYNRWTKVTAAVFSANPWGVELNGYQIMEFWKYIIIRPIQSQLILAPGNITVVSCSLILVVLF